MELQPQQISGGDLQKRRKIEFLLVWFILLFGTGCSYQSEFVLDKRCTSIWVRNVRYRIGWSWRGAHSVFHKPWLCLSYPECALGVCRPGCWLDIVQHSGLGQATSQFFQSKTWSKVLEIHSNKLLLFSTTTSQRDAAVIKLGTMISTDYFLVGT